MQYVANLQYVVCWQCLLFTFVYLYLFVFLKLIFFSLVTFRRANFQGVNLLAKKNCKEKMKGLGSPNILHLPTPLDSCESVSRHGLHRNKKPHEKPHFCAFPIEKYRLARNDPLLPSTFDGRPWPRWRWNLWFLRQNDREGWTYNIIEAFGKIIVTPLPLPLVR